MAQLQPDRTTQALLRWILAVVILSVIVSITKAVVDSRTKDEMGQTIQDLRAEVKAETKIVDMLNKRSDDQQKRNQLEDNWIGLVSHAVGVKLDDENR